MYISDFDFLNLSLDVLKTGLLHFAISLHRKQGGKDVFFFQKIYSKLNITTW